MTTVPLSPIRASAITLLADLASGSVMVVDSDRAVETVDAFLVGFAAAVAGKMIENIEGHVERSASESTRIWGASLASHLRTKWAVP